MPKPGVPAIGRMSMIIRAGGKPPLQHRAFAPAQTGSVQRFGTPFGPTFLYTAANWGAVNWYLEIYMRSTSAKALAQLYDNTAGAVVDGSLITDDNAVDGLTTYTRARSGALTLTDGHEYQVQLGNQDGGAGGLLGAKLIAR